MSDYYRSNVGSTVEVSEIESLADGVFIVGDGTGAPAQESGNTARTSMGLGTGDTVQFSKLGIINPHDLGVGLHVKSGDAGAVTVDVSVDELVIEGNGQTGMTIAAPDANNARIAFVSPSSTNLGNYIEYYYNSGNDYLVTKVDNTNMLYIQGGKIGIENTSLESWAAAETALQIGGNAVLYADQAQGATKDFVIGQNVYDDGIEKAISTDEGSLIRLQDGTIVFDVFSSTTADAAISGQLTTALTIANSGAVDVVGDFTAGTIGTDKEVNFLPTTAPASPAEGDVYYDSTANKLKVYNGTAWETITSS